MVTQFTFPPTLYEGSNFSMCSSTLVNVCLFGFKQLLFSASSPKQLGRIGGGRDTLQFTRHPGLTSGPSLVTSPPGHTLPGRAALGEIARIKWGGKGEGGLRSSRTWCAPRPGMPGHAAFPVWLRPQTWAGEAPPLPGSRPRPGPAPEGAPSAWGAGGESETPDPRVGGGPGGRWRDPGARLGPARLFRGFHSFWAKGSCGPRPDSPGDRGERGRGGRFRAWERLAPGGFGAPQEVSVFPDGRPVHRITGSS